MKPQRQRPVFIVSGFLALIALIFASTLASAAGTTQANAPTSITTDKPPAATSTPTQAAGGTATNIATSILTSKITSKLSNVLATDPPVISLSSSCTPDAQGTLTITDIGGDMTGPGTWALLLNGTSIASNTFQLSAGQTLTIHTSGLFGTLELDTSGGGAAPATTSTFCQSPTATPTVTATLAPTIQLSASCTPAAQGTLTITDIGSDMTSAGTWTLLLNGTPIASNSFQLSAGQTLTIHTAGLFGTLELDTSGGGTAPATTSTFCQSPTATPTIVPPTIQLSAECTPAAQGTFILTNIGSDMTSPGSYTLLLNGAPIATGTFQLNAGASTQIHTAGLFGTLELDTSGGGTVPTTVSTLCQSPTATPTNTPDITDTPTNTPTQTPTDTPTNTPTNTITNTPTDTSTPTPTGTFTLTPTPQMGQLSVCKKAGTGVQNGQVFTFQVGTATYNVAAGSCALIGQFPLNTQVTVQENIPTGYYVADLDIRPTSQKVSEDKAHGRAVARIGSGVTTVTFENKAVATPTSTPVAQGVLQICKQADGTGVSGKFKFTFGTKSKTVSVGKCSSTSSVNAGTLTITESARAGYVLSDVYTIPAGRLLSKDLNARSATISIAPGTGSSKTVVVFVNRAVHSQAVPDGTTLTYQPAAASNDFGVLWRDIWQALLGTNRELQFWSSTSSYAN